MATIEGCGEEIHKPKPLKAVMPLQAMHRTSPLCLRNRISPDTEISPSLDLSTVITGKNWAWAGPVGGSGEGSSTLMRRTASLDAIYLKGQWPKESHTHFSRLLLDKATQTPEEWIPCCLAEVGLTEGCSTVESSSGGNYGNSNGSSSSSSSNGSRRASGSLPSSPWPTGGPSHATPAPGENIEKFIRQRLQRTNKEGTGIPWSRYSPIHADHSVLAPTPVLAKPYACVQTHVCHSSLCEGTPRSASIPQLPRPLLPRFRSSVEELNQEIESLVLRPSDLVSEEDYEWNSIHQDGRRAPIPDYFRQRRSVNTQTPARCSSTASANSSNHTSPSLSPTMSPPSVQGVSTPPDSPGPPRLPSSFASPHINKFLTREPPDGCERVALKPSEDTCGTSWPPVKPPSSVFTLLPSLGSAFCAPGKTSSSSRGVLAYSQGSPERKCSKETPHRSKEGSPSSISSPRKSPGKQ